MPLSGEVHTVTPVAIPGTDQQLVCSGSGAEYRVMTAWPDGPPPSGGFPVVYVLDADTSFGTFVEGVRLRARRADATGVAPGIIVGITYPAGEPNDRGRRRLDYAPAGSRDSGGGDAASLLALLDEVIKPRVAEAYAVDPARQSIFGHSLSGRFVLEVLATSPASFDTYVAVSPSIWLERDQLMRDIEALEDHDADLLSSRQVMVTVGEYEQVLAPWQLGTDGAEAIAARRRERRMVDDAREVATRLGDVCGRVWFEEFPGEDHASVLTVSISRALRFCLSPKGQRCV